MRQNWSDTSAIQRQNWTKDNEGKQEGQRNTHIDGIEVMTETLWKKKNRKIKCVCRVCAFSTTEAQCCQSNTISHNDILRRVY